MADFSSILNIRGGEKLWGGKAPTAELCWAGKAHMGHKQNVNVVKLKLHGKLSKTALISINI